MIPSPLRALRWVWLLAGLTATGLSPLVQALELNGVTVTPHLQLDTITVIVKRTEKRRSIRNLFIHGLWNPKTFGEPNVE